MSQTPSDYITRLTRLTGLTMQAFPIYYTLSRPLMVRPGYEVNIVIENSSTMHHPDLRSNYWSSNFNSPVTSYTWLWSQPCTILPFAGYLSRASVNGRWFVIGTRLGIGLWLPPPIYICLQSTVLVHGARYRGYGGITTHAL